MKKMKKWTEIELLEALKEREQKKYEEMLEAYELFGKDSYYAERKLACWCELVDLCCDLFGISFEEYLEYSSTH